MKQRYLIFSAIIMALFFTSCILSPSIRGNGNVVQEERTSGAFDKIKVSSGMNVYLSQGETSKVTVKADENLLDVIDTEIMGDVLEITSSANIKKATVLKIYVTTPHLISARAFAGSNIFSETIINTDKLEISASAGSNIKLEIHVDETKISASAGSNIMVKGEATNFEGKASSGSNIRAEKLTTLNGEAKTSSGANIWITCKTKLTGNASSGGNIFYYGAPRNTEIHHSSGGNVISKEDKM